VLDDITNDLSLSYPWTEALIDFYYARNGNKT